MPGEEGEGRGVVRKAGRVMRQPSVFCMLRVVVGFCFFFFLFFFYFSFPLIVMPIYALSFPHSLSLSPAFFGHRVSQEFLVKLKRGVEREGELGGYCSHPTGTSSSNNTYKSFVCLVCCFPRTRVSL